MILRGLLVIFIISIIYPLLIIAASIAAILICAYDLKFKRIKQPFKDLFGETFMMIEDDIRHEIHYKTILDFLKNRRTKIDKM